jgi:hypothetical protein
LSSGHSRCCVARPAKDVERRIALRVDFVATVQREGFANHAAMLCLSFGPAIGELSREARRPFDVREDEGDRTAAQISHDQVRARGGTIVNSVLCSPVEGESPPRRAPRAAAPG